MELSGSCRQFASTIARGNQVPAPTVETILKFRKIGHWSKERLIAVEGKIVVFLDERE
jgi:hypothetical protein